MNSAVCKGGTQEVMVIDLSQRVESAPRRWQLRHVCREDGMRSNGDQPLSGSGAKWQPQRIVDIAVQFLASLLQPTSSVENALGGFLPGAGNGLLEEGL